MGEIVYLQYVCWFAANYTELNNSEKPKQPEQKSRCLQKIGWKSIHFSNIFLKINYKKPKLVSETIPSTDDQHLVPKKNFP